MVPSQVLEYAWKFRLMKKHQVCQILTHSENACRVGVLKLLFSLPQSSSSALPKTSAQAGTGSFFQEDTWARLHVSRGKEEQKDFSIMSLLRAMLSTPLSPFKSGKLHEHRSQEMRKNPHLRSNLPPQKAPPSSRAHQVSEGEVGLPHSRVKRILKF